MTTSKPASAMIEGRRADSARRRQRVIKALNTATAAGTEITVSAIARAAHVDRTFLYRHRDLLTQIHTAQNHAGDPAGIGVSVASLRADSSTPTNGLQGKPPASEAWKRSCPNCSVIKSGVTADSAHHKISTNSSAASLNSNNMSSP